MFSENEIRVLERDLTSFRAQNDKNQEAQSILIDKYRQLLSDYKSLQNDYDETKEARDRYKKMVKGVDRSPFVLLLVDGDNYVFEDSFVKAGSDGGENAASLIRTAMLDHARRLGLPSDCRVVVRILLNLQGMSSAFHRHGICGSHARAIAPFTTGISRAYDLFDVVDCGERRESVEGKVKENFSFHIENNSCRHIFFAGCHDNTYLSMIKDLEGRTDRVTLVKSAKFSPHYNDLGLQVEELVGIFRTDVIEITPSVRSGPSSSGPEPSVSEFKQNLAWKVKNADAWQDGGFDSASKLNDSPQQSPAWQETRPRTDSWEDSSRSYRPNQSFCTHWARGMCRYGARCTKRHEFPPDPRSNGILDKYGPPGNGRAAVSDDWRSPTASGPRNPSLPYGGQSVESDNVSIWSGGMEASVVADALPRLSEAVEDLIPVNKDGYRLDFYAGPWDRDDAAEYQRRIAMVKPCNEFQLTGQCKNGMTCNYDHGKLEKRLIEVLRQIVHDYPCRMRGACRKKNCQLGHLCYNMRCGGGRRGPGCRLDAHMHQVDPHVSDWVAVAQPEMLDENGERFTEGDLLGESFDDSATEDKKPSTRNFALTSQWAQSVLSPTPSGVQSPAPILSAVEPTEATPETAKSYHAGHNDTWGTSSRQSQDWDNTNGRSSRWNANDDIDHEHEHPAVEAAARNHRDRDSTNGWNSGHQHYHEDGSKQNLAPPADEYRVTPDDVERRQDAQPNQ